MKNNFLIITNTNIFNRQFINILKENCEDKIDTEDRIYISEKGIIQTLWKLHKETKGSYQFEKIKVIREGCQIHELTTSIEKNERIIKLEDKQDIQYLERIFEHKIKIYPQYNIKNLLEKDIKLVQELKRCDPKVVFYYNAINDNSQKASVAIIKNYGVCIIENFEEQFLRNIDSNIDTVLDRLAKSKSLYRDKQLQELKSNMILSEKDKLNIQYKKYILCDQLDEDKLSILNTLIQERLDSTEFVTIEELMKQLLMISSTDDIAVDEQKEYGIKCALMPQYVINKSTIQYQRDDNGKIRILTDNMIELDDEQIRILDELNERTYIEATAGTGKSVLLLAKAYMLAKENPNKEFLFICFNSRLSEEIENEAKYKNQQIENLKIRTFDKFIQENFSNTNNWEENHRIFLEKVRNRK